MIALSTFTEIKSNEIYVKLDYFLAALNKVTLITRVWGIKTIAQVAAKNKNCKKIFPILIKQLKNCISCDVPIHAESILPAIAVENKQEFFRIIEARNDYLTNQKIKNSNKISLDYLGFVETLLKKCLIYYSNFQVLLGCCFSNYPE